MASQDFDAYCSHTFGCHVPMLLRAMEHSPSSRGYVLGAISEETLKDHLEARNYEVLRIVEKPSGGFTAKSDEARGDFYVKKDGADEDGWLVVESKGLKSNSEFRGAMFEDRDKVFRFLKKWAFRDPEWREKCYDKGLKKYNKEKEKWEAKHPKQRFPAFGWSRRTPGPVSCDLSEIWESEDELKGYVYSLPDEAFTEEAYRCRRGALAVLETHKPSTRVAPFTGIKHAAPLVSEFSVLAVDLYLRTGQHEFAFMNPETISHSPTSPEHLYQNYTIDVLIPRLKPRPRIGPPWYDDLDTCVAETNPGCRELDETQINHRGKNS